MSHTRMILTTAIWVWLLGSAVLCLPVAGREAKLEIHPAKLPEGVGAYSLLPDETDLTEGDAVPLYEQAVKALPGGSRTDQISDWLNLPIEQLPLQQAEATVHQHIESLRLLAKAARCKECNWPEWKPGTPPSDQQGYREIAFVIALSARIEMAQGEYDGALLALQTGFGMARHLGQSTTLIQTLVGAAIAGLMCQEVEQFVQGRDAPNLYGALADLPAPLVDVEPAIEYERRVGLGKVTNEALRQQLENQLKPAHNRVRLISRRLDAQLAALQCVEALRGYAASQAGRLPKALADIPDVSLPGDPLTGRPFAYRQTGSKATLGSAIPSGGDERDQIRYEVTVKR